MEILTSEKQHPQKEWVVFIITAKAKCHFVAYFKKDRKKMLKEGIVLFEKILREMELSPTSEPLKKVLTSFNIQNKEDLYVKLGAGVISSEEVIKELKKKGGNRFMKYWKLQFFRNDREEDEKKEREAKTQDSDSNEDIVISPCCNPIPGDDVVGMDIGGKVTVHKRKCPEAIRLMSSYGDKIVPVKWVSHQMMSFPAMMRMRGIDRSGVVSEITTIISKEIQVNMRIVHFETKDGIFEGAIRVYVHNTDNLNRLMVKISGIKGVESVTRE